MKESRLYSFIDHKNGFNLHILDGKRVMQDLMTIHNIGEIAYPYYRSTVFSSLMLMNFLKPGENLGVYIDSEQPYFRYKIEMNAEGSIRTLLLPEEFSEFPTRIDGVARISKMFHGKTPYTSVIKLDSAQTQQIINDVLQDSYQTQSKVMMNDTGNQVVMITKLPKKNVNKSFDEEPNLSMAAFELLNNPLLQSIFNIEQVDISSLVDLVEKEGFTYLHSRQIKFNCPCSKDKMITNMMSLQLDDLDEIFEDDKPHIEVRCDYCNTNYQISRSELT